MLFPGAEYELMVDVGWRNDLPNSGTEYFVGLSAGAPQTDAPNANDANYLATVTNAQLALIQGQFVTATVSYTAGAMPSQDSLHIVLASSTQTATQNQIAFDNVRFFSSVPEPSSLGLGLIGLCAGALRRKRRKIN